jgi:hypothetical protein
MMVTCYLVQHGRSSDDGRAWAAQMLRLHLDPSLSEPQFGYQITRGAREGRRRWRFKRAAEARVLPRVAWALTIAEVAGGTQDGVSYGRMGTAWARATLEQMPALGY